MGLIEEGPSCLSTGRPRSAVTLTPSLTMHGIATQKVEPGNFGDNEIYRFSLGTVPTLK